MLIPSCVSSAGLLLCRLLSPYRLFVRLVDLEIYCSLVPVLVSRLILSLRRAADEGLILCWNEDHLSIERWNGDTHELTDLSFRSSYTTRGMRTEGTTA